MIATELRQSASLFLAPEEVVAQETTRPRRPENRFCLTENVSDAGLKRAAKAVAVVIIDHIRLISGPAPSPQGGPRIDSSSRFVDWEGSSRFAATTKCKLEKFGETHAKS